MSHIPIGDCAMANELREPSILNFGAFQPAHDRPSAWLKSAQASTPHGQSACPFPVPAWRSAGLRTPGRRIRRQHLAALLLSSALNRHGRGQRTVWSWLPTNRELPRSAAMHRRRPTARPPSLLLRLPNTDGNLRCSEPACFPQIVLFLAILESPPAAPRRNPVASPPCA